MTVYRLNNKVVSKEEFMADKKGIDFETGIVRGQRSSTWPMHSDALGVNPSQAQEAYEESIKMGCPTTFDKDGCAVLTSARHRKKYAEANGMRDNNAGYSCPQPR